jgi:hypothetical protein
LGLWEGGGGVSIARPLELAPLKADLFHAPRMAWPGVYFLCREGAVVYVGQGKIAGSRAMQHKDKQWDEVFVLPCKQDQLNRVEAALISVLKPPYNKVTHRSGNEVYHHPDVWAFLKPMTALGGIWNEAVAA